MNRANEPAYPVPLGAEEGLAAGMNPNGLTKREHFAALAMQGILANPIYDPPRRAKLGGMSEDAVAAADALLAELEKQ